MTTYQEQLTKNAIGHLMPELEEVGIQSLAKAAIKKCIWNLSNKLCELNVNNVTKVNDEKGTTEKNFNE